jgi:hypothetical protein
VSTSHFIHKENPALTFFFSYKHSKCYYKYITVLPFRLCSAGHIFTKVVRTFVNYWRFQSFPTIVYLDDRWACDTQKRCTRMAKIVLQNLLDSGFLPYFEKSIFILTKTLDWLGFTWNLEDGVIEVPKNWKNNFATLYYCKKFSIRVG